MYQWLLSAGSAKPTKSDESVLVTNYMYLRKTVGWLGTLLPIVLLICNPIALQVESSPCGWLPGSVSGYYYTPVRNVFVGALCGLGVFLIAYVGADIGDRIITDLAGLFSILVAFFPTKPSVAVTPSIRCQTVAQPSSGQQVVGVIHLVSAGCLFVLLAWMAIRFTKTDAPVLSPQKLRRNLIYKICAALILACVAVAVLTSFLPMSVKTLFPWLFAFEALAIFAFGVSWFVKGQTLVPQLKDTPAVAQSVARRGARGGLQRPPAR
jgi:hypothetical protein